MKNEIKDFSFDHNDYLEFESELYNELEETYGGNKIFDLNEIIADSEEFKRMYGHIYYILEEGFEIEKIRKAEIVEEKDDESDDGNLSPPLYESDEELRKFSITKHDYLLKKGDLIMEVGSTGNSTGNHLHLEIRIDRKAINPQKYLYK